MNKTYAIILAGGSGTRLQAELPKAFVEVKGRSIIKHTIRPFQQCKAIDYIILVVPKAYIQKCQAWQADFPKVLKVIGGGATRYHSSRLGLTEVPNDKDKVLMHDAARPFVDIVTIERCIAALEIYDAVSLLSPVSNSMVRMQDGQIVEAVNRDEFRQVLTPQSFRKGCLHKAQLMAEQLPLDSITDDFNLVNRFETGTSSWIESNAHNIKITYPQDLKMASFLL